MIIKTKNLTKEYEAGSQIVKALNGIDLSVEKGEFISGEIIPIKQINGGYVKLDTEKKVIKKIQDLTNLDFPENSIIIDDEGNIRKR